MRQNRINADGRSNEPTDGSWFVPKRYGYGATPVRWQDWALVAAYIAAMLGIGSSELPLVGAGHVAGRDDGYLYGDCHSQNAGRLAMALGWSKVK